MKFSSFEFRKSSYSQVGNNDCVEVADAPGVSAMRDSQHPHLGYLEFVSGEWVALVASVRRGEI
ncbi:DUF397 domain-containing protein [Nocardiopsis gilva YIM 90087]|uniref:DUF397 domain-containing protein n=1 Tax=Nocardiopsis gilva YIM 90087 TaxID=1235441 RepID=A0A223S206_9ACTN|nr:DUF397 domain-containing protein [Nocardiopsis gilva]ASU82049.1 DUF397 domain-containing protein [Nocardiopsis gilva YIM 90087]